MQLLLLAHVGATLSAAHAAPVRALKQFKFPTANSEPRSTTNGSDRNLWFTLGGENANVPSKIGRITSAGVITEFGSACELKGARAGVCSMKRSLSGLPRTPSRRSSENAPSTWLG